MWSAHPCVHMDISTKLEKSPSRCYWDITFTRVGWMDRQPKDITPQALTVTGEETLQVQPDIPRPARKNKASRFRKAQQTTGTCCMTVKACGRHLVADEWRGLRKKNISLKSTRTSKIQVSTGECRIHMMPWWRSEKEGGDERAERPVRNHWRVTCSASLPSCTCPPPSLALHASLLPSPLLCLSQHRPSCFLPFPSRSLSVSPSLPGCQVSGIN